MLAAAVLVVVPVVPPVPPVSVVVVPDAGLVEPVSLPQEGKKRVSIIKGIRIPNFQFPIPDFQFLFNIE